ncbi:hypothetical protein BASA81_010779 [Batrachochytrium salamandrivorans]|nr:hypothetical protein BASA81_010779 [Batrachochytrium salamandrivorans]
MADSFDLGLLAAFSVEQNNEQANVQSLVDELFKLPKKDEGSFTVHLPDVTTRLPRQYPPPKPKVETKWEKYAKEKGIQKTKKDRMVYDEHTDSYKPRYGYGRAVGTGGNLAPILELKKTDRDDVDPFEVARDKLATKKLKQKGHELKNLENKLAVRGRKGNRTDFEPKVFKSNKGEDEPSTIKNKSVLEAKKKLLQITQTSTRSFGRFDRKVKNEPERKPLLVQKKKRTNAAANVGEEKDRAMKILKRLNN